MFYIKKTNKNHNYLKIPKKPESPKNFVVVL